jgi:membrane protein insertase Oxa1/YidC/SpoIIIJ
MEVQRDVTFYSNYIIFILALIAFPIAIYFYWHSKEVKRWADSDYSPYVYE